MHTLIEYIEYMPVTQRQYTLRNIPDRVDRVLRRRARETGKSFNQVAVEALSDGAGEGELHDDLDFMIGSMSDGEARALERDIAAQRRIDRDLWR
jgi:hypothetical protein